MYKTLSKKQKLDLISYLNWDYTDKSENLLKLIETGNSDNCSFSQETLFARSLETFSWDELCNLWTCEKCINLYSSKVQKMIFNPFLRWKYDRIFAILRNEPLPITEQDSKYFEEMQKSFLFNRRNCTK